MPVLCRISRVSSSAFGLLDNRFTLIVDSYQVVIPGEDTLIVGGEPDSRCSLLDTRDSTDLELNFLLNGRWIPLGPLALEHGVRGR